MKFRKPRKLPKAERIASALHQRVRHERSQTTAAEREAHLRALMGLSAKPSQEIDQECDE
jgi:hypothetical protein